MVIGSFIRNMAETDIICIWPNGDYCYEEELEEYLETRSDDYSETILPPEYGDEEVDVFVYFFNKEGKSRNAK